MELGPCTVIQDSRYVAEIKLKYHPQLWNEFSNVFFVDQSVDVGFLCKEHRERVVTVFWFCWFPLKGCDTSIECYGSLSHTRYRCIHWWTFPYVQRESNPYG